MTNISSQLNGEILELISAHEIGKNIDTNKECLCAVLNSLGYGHIDDGDVQLGSHEQNGRNYQFVQSFFKPRNRPVELSEQDQNAIIQKSGQDVISFKAYDLKQYLRGEEN